MGQLTKSIAEFISSSSTLELPDEAINIVSAGFCDTVGVTIAGMREPIWTRLKQLTLSSNGPREARLFLGPDKVSARDAAMVGAATAHALDYDDYAFSNHVSAVLVPMILAEAEFVNASGYDMLRAYVVGYEVWRIIMKREPDDLYIRGWHPTAVYGAFGAVAAAASLHHMDNIDEITNAIGLAVALGSGVMDNFGSMGKPIQGGRAAEAGLQSVRLAKAGIDAGRDALDGPNGLLLALSPERRYDVSTPADTLGQDWGIVSERLNVKRYPTVGSSQRCADAAIQLHNSGGFKISDIRRIRPKVSIKHDRVMPVHRPKTGLEAKFSLELIVVAGLIEGKVGFAEISDTFVQRPDVQALIELVETEIGPDDDPEFSAGGRADIIHLDLVDGSTISSEEVTRWRGHAARPMSNQELKTKFMDCAQLVISPQQAEIYFEIFSNIHKLKNTDEIPVLV